MRDDVQGFYDRIYAALSSETDLSQIPEWMEKNTKHPLKPSKPWTFEGHEYQLEIVSSDAQHLVCKKCSQVGASEIFARLLLAMMDVMQALTAIYIMPTSMMAGKFTKGRLDPIIAGSQRLRDRCSKDVDSNSMKQFGNSFMHVVGSFGQNSAISTPAQAMFRDEFDFCNQSVLTLFMSRLGHAENGGIIRDFSTPTVPGYGIDELYEQSSKGIFAVYCGSCDTWVLPKFMEHVVIPGYNGNMTLLEKEDLTRTDIDIDGAYCKCPLCAEPIAWENFLQTKERRWVHQVPDAEIRGYHVQPWDVPTVNNIPKVIRSLADYERKMDWVNMKAGESFADAENSFVSGVIKQNTEGPEIQVPTGTDLLECVPLFTGCIMAADVGKHTTWLLVGLPLEKGGYEVIYSERIRQTADNFLVARWNYVAKFFGVVMGVIDAGPDFTSSTMIAGSAPGRFWKCYYTKNDGKKLNNIQTDEEEATISAFRTGCFDATSRRVNSGYVRFRHLADMPTMLEHLEALKRVDAVDGSGEIVSTWTSTKDDHYAHSLNYLNMAYELSTKAAAAPVKGVLPMMTKVKVKSGEVSSETFARTGRR